MRVVFLIRSLHTGGAERQLVVLANALASAGHEIDVVTFYSGGNLESLLEVPKLRLSSIAKRSRWDLFGPWFRWKKLIQERSPDVVYSFLVEPNLLNVLTRLILPTAKIVWGVRASSMEATQKGLSALTFRLSVWLSRFADLVIFNSDAGRDYHLGRGYSPRQAMVIENGIDSSLFRFDPGARRAVRSLLGLSDSTTLLGYVARLDPIKNHGLLFRALSIVISDFPEIQLVLLGEGPEAASARIKEQARELGIGSNLHFRPSTSQVADWYSAFDLAVSCSVAEGFPNGVAEAMACGTPVFATPAGDSAKIVSNLGWIAKDFSVSSFEQGLREALKDCKKANRSEISLSISERFGVKRLQERTASALLAIRK